MLDNLYIIVAIDDDRGIAKDGIIPWDNLKDRIYFRKMTLHSSVIMSKKVFGSLKKGYLDKRKNIILTRREFYSSFEDIFVYYEYNKLLNYIKHNKEEQFFVIGGNEIYKLFLPYVRKIYLSHIKGSYGTDLYFPNFEDQFDEVSKIETGSVDFITYARKNDKNI